jgi:carboxylesterase
MRPWGEYLAEQGLTVSLPRLPGHGTTWQEMNLTRWEDWYAEVDRAFDDLTNRCESIFVMGLSMGATLTIRLAEVRGAAVSGLVVVNPSLLSENPQLRALPLIKGLVKSVKGLSNDIKMAGQDEIAYDRVPTRALHSLTQLWAVTRKDLPQVTQPLLVFRSVEDHVVEPASAALLLSSVSSTDVEERLLRDSYHVATIDNDARQIFEGSLDFVRRLAPAATGS